jgi:hypothetical protein
MSIDIDFYFALHEGRGVTYAITKTASIFAVSMEVAEGATMACAATIAIAAPFCGLVAGLVTGVAMAFIPASFWSYLDRTMANSAMIA